MKILVHNGKPEEQQRLNKYITHQHWTHKNWTQKYGIGQSKKKLAKKLKICREFKINNKNYLKIKISQDCNVITILKYFCSSRSENR